MLQDEVVRTWSGDFQKSSQHPSIKQLNSSAGKSVSGQIGFWLLAFGWVRPVAAAEQVPSGPICLLMKPQPNYGPLGMACREV